MRTNTAPQRSSGVPDTLQLAGRTPRTSFVDRVAMRVALALLLWSTRPQLSADEAEAALARRAADDRREREAAWLWLALGTRPL
ncbi:MULTISPECIES: hypothetical protein [unclassified Microbacterium]|uniref:hypothetical protein n=1 Tax=unclassified Microbacterium TaxID=2609290 RepID=UPI00214C82F6|nr:MULTISPECIES: hypothetical protein [unclassified Microbacterium]MCR2785404.1 hypothetical protein [Microbacterium sp. zg.B96]MDL5350453.1 hypothetical protein [Microbacterium sp. zg-YB36]WIM14566.1 hypothetical protein QNO11_08240 [Microbacterium sp. zg-B96]